MARHVAVPYDAVYPFGDNFAVPAYHTGKRKFALGHGGCRQLNAPLHHPRIDFRTIHEADTVQREAKNDAGEGQSTAAWNRATPAHTKHTPISVNANRKIQAGANPHLAAPNNDWSLNRAN